MDLVGLALSAFSCCCCFTVVLVMVGAAFALMGGGGDDGDPRASLVRMVQDYTNLFYLPAASAS